MVFEIDTCWACHEGLIAQQYDLLSSKKFLDHPTRSHPFGISGTLRHNFTMYEMIEQIKYTSP
jgi:hypothetical protein